MRKPTMIMMVIMTFVFAVKSYAFTLKEAEDVFYDYDKGLSYLQKSIDMFDQIVKESKDTNVLYEAYWMQSRVYLTLGDQAEPTHTDALKDYEAGKAAGEQAIKINPKGAMGYFWYAANLGRMGQVKGILNSLFMLPTFRKNLDEAYRLAPNEPEVLEAYGEMYNQLPWIAGGSASKAIDYFKRSLKSDPNFTLSMAEMGSAYINDGKYEQAREILEKVMNFETPTYRGDWVWYDKPLAKRLLDSIKDKK